MESSSRKLVCKCPITSRVPQYHLCFREFIYTSLMQHFKAGKSTIQQCAAHPHTIQYKTDFNRDQNVSVSGFLKIKCIFLENHEDKF